jgi:hypothetical protein
MVQMDGDGHLKIQLAVPVAGQGLRDRFQYEFFCSQTKHLVNFMVTRVWRCQQSLMITVRGATNLLHGMTP